ncbi:MAG: hypothetical protein GY801_36195 [bacterium]|nr:hypothetical protein [bacterium]
MTVYLPEKIGDPDLFSGRRKELAMFSSWINNIQKGISKSTAILSRRKTGKTALMQRLYNLTFEKNAGVIPFYYEVREGPQWSVEFCRDFFLTFLSQYIAFQTRNPTYLTLPGKQKGTFTGIREIVRKERLDYLIDDIDGVEELAREESIDRLWHIVRDTPRSLAARRNERIVQMIDEFQYLNSEIYWDREKMRVANEFAAGYMSTAEYRIAPLLISGSWIGWLREILHTMLPSRFRQLGLEDMPENETVEMIYNYARFYDVPMKEEVVYGMAKLCEGNPFYVSALFESGTVGNDLSTPEGLLKTLEYETLHSHGHIRGVWMEYLGKVFYKVNQENAKKLVLYLCQHRDREVSREELMKKLQLTMTERELEEKLHALVKSDIIEEGRSNFYYRGVRDNIFDKVFRGQYADDIRHFAPEEITQEYNTLYEQAKHEYRGLLGKHNQLKGLFAEFAIINQLRLHAVEKQDLFRSITQNLPEDFRFVEYEHVWSYKFTRPDKSDMWIDILAHAGEESYSLIGEVKNRSSKAFSLAEAEEFARKAREAQEREQLRRAVLFVFSLKGFTKDALEYFQARGIAYSDDDRWLGE